MATRGLHRGHTVLACPLLVWTVARLRLCHRHVCRKLEDQLRHSRPELGPNRVSAGLGRRPGAGPGGSGTTKAQLRRRSWIKTKVTGRRDEDLALSPRPCCARLGHRFQLLRDRREKSAHSFVGSVDGQRPVCFTTTSPADKLVKEVNATPFMKIVVLNSQGLLPPQQTAKGSLVGWFWYTGPT